MARHRKKNAAPLKPPGTKNPAPKTARAGARLWCFRLGAVVLVPLLFLLVLESGLRLAGFGYPTSFLLSAEQHGRQMLIPNNRFTWRFFGPNYAREPVPFAIPRVKPADTVRIFVFGGSAAFGDPQPDFGLSRMLQAMLSLRYPQTHFEVVNAAMTAINSHTVLPIARDCARAYGDIWVIYLGNNEVVGPFGAGTVFGPKAPSLPFIRTILAFKSTRTGELLDELVRKLHPPPEDESEWGGMLMFLKNEVRQDDPRMQAVYYNFQQNLDDILEAGRRSGARVVLSTVAVNLKDCAPFASEHRPGLSDALKARWRGLYQQGSNAQAAGKPEQAVQFFSQAGKIDDSVAQLQYVWAQSCLALGQTGEAQRRFALARDLDVLRFRCDSRLNEIIRHVAASHEQDGVRLADAEKEFALATPDGLPGEKFFYEHVHLTFAGNYLLARVIADQAVKLLPESVRHQTNAGQPWPSEAECARRLGWTDWSRLTGIDNMLGRLTDPPFINQVNHVAQMRYLEGEAEKLRPGAQQALREAKKLFAPALATAPDDPVLYSELGQMLALSDDAEGATKCARRVVDLLPNSSPGWTELAIALAEQKRYAEAVDAFKQAYRQDPQDFWALQGLAQAYAALGRRDEAIREYRRLIAIKPRMGPAYLGLGQLLEAEGRKQEAEENYRNALKYPLHRAADLTTLARFCQDRGWFGDAVTNYLDAIRLKPVDPGLRVEAGRCLDTLGRNAEALEQYRQAVQLAPNSVPARFLLGLELGRHGKPAEAAEQFREVVRLMPSLDEARVNLGISLDRLGRRSEALEQFQEVLQHNPTNAVALENVRRLKAEADPKPAR